jgi:hypothetical protein
MVHRKKNIRPGSASEFRYFGLTRKDASTNFRRVVKVFILVVPDFIAGVAMSALRNKVLNQKPKAWRRESAAYVFLREVSSIC